MKQWTSVLFLLSLLFSSCTKSIRGHGDSITETRSVDAVTSVQLEGTAIVDIVQGNVQVVTVSGYENLVPIFLTEVNNGNLVLRFKDPYYRVRKNNIRVTVVLPDLQQVRSNGSGQVNISNFFNKSYLAGSVNGTGNITIANFSFLRVSLKVNGTGNIYALGCTALEAETEIFGSGNIELTCSQKISAFVYGSGNIDYWGRPAISNTLVSGTGRIRRK